VALLAKEVMAIRQYRRMGLAESQLSKHPHLYTHGPGFEGNRLVTTVMLSEIRDAEKRCRRSHFAIVGDKSSFRSLTVLGVTRSSH
jgi:hypothetical protein